MPLSDHAGPSPYVLACSLVFVTNCVTKDDETKTTHSARGSLSAYSCHHERMHHREGHHAGATSLIARYGLAPSQGPCPLPPPK